MTETGVEQTIDESALVAALARHAPGWLGQPEPGSVSVVEVQARTQSFLIRAEIAAGDIRRPVFVKIPRPARRRPGGGFRLFDPVSDPAEKARFEFATLAAVDETLAARGDERFGWARAYGHLPELSAIVVGVVEGLTLDRVLRRGRRHGPDDDHQLEVMDRSGALLSAFHTAATDHMVRRDISFDEVAADVTDLLGHLRGQGRAARFEHTVSDIVARFDHHSTWPTRPVMGHGDFAPRNIFVDDELRVSTVDSLGRFQVPPQEDVAYLLVELATGATRYSRPGFPWSNAWQRRLRRSLLAGYPMADDPVLRLFEIRALLDKWRSLADRADRSRSARAATRDRFRELLVERELGVVADRLQTDVR